MSVEIVSFPVPRKIAYDELLRTYKAVALPVFDRDKVFNPESVRVFKTTTARKEFLDSGVSKDVVDFFWEGQTGKEEADDEKETPLTVHLRRNSIQFVNPDSHITLSLNLDIPTHLFGVEIITPFFAEYDRDSSKWIKGLLGQEENGFGRINTPGHPEHVKHDRIMGNAFLQVLDGMIKDGRLELVYDSDEEIQIIEDGLHRMRQDPRPLVGEEVNLREGQLVAVVA